MPAEAALPTFADLQRELPPLSPRAWRFAVLRGSSRAGALLSDGLRIGYSQGFDSGPFMAHVYANRPTGRTALGRAIDRRLLGRRTCVAFRDIRAIAERALFDALRAERGPAPVVADLAAGPAPYLLAALTRHTRAQAIVGDTDPEALAAARRDAEALGIADRVQFVQASAFDRNALERLRPSPDVVVELGLYGIYHDDGLIQRHFQDLAALVEPQPDRVQRPDAQPRHRAHRTRVGQPGGRALHLAPAARRTAARMGARRGLRARDGRSGPLRHLSRRPARARGRGGMTNVLTWAPGGALAVGSRRLAALQASHHAMWNYVTYRDAIALVGGTAEELYPEGTTRLPDDWADLGWLTCFHGPPASALEAMRTALVPDALDVYPPDLIEPLREEAARALGRARDGSFEVVGTEGAQAGLTLALLAAIDPGDEVVLGDPGYFHLPAAVLAAGGVPVTVAIGPENGYRLDPDAVAAAITPRTRAICLVDPSNPYGTLATDDEVAALTALAERHGLLLIHDVTHGLLAIEPGAPVGDRPRRRARRRDLLGLALLRDGRRAHGLPGRPSGPHARLPAAQGGAHPAQHEPGLPARSARGAARRRLPPGRRDGHPRQSGAPRADAGRASTALTSRWRLAAASRARSSSTTRDRRRRS